MINKKLLNISISLVLTLGSFSLIVTPALAVSTMNDAAPAMPNSAPPVPPGDGMGPMSVSPTGMMGGAPGVMKETASPSATNMDQEDITLGQNLYLKFKNSQTPCQNFSADDFEKMGAYMLNQQLGNATYAQMGQMIQDPEKQQINIAAGKSATNCTAASMMPAPTQPMMEDNNKEMTDASDKTDSVMMGLAIGSMVAILLNVLLTIILLSKIGKTGSKNNGSGPKPPTSPSTPSTGSGPMPTPKPSMPPTHPGSSSLFPSGAAAQQAPHMPIPSTNSGSSTQTPLSHAPTPMPVAHTPMPPMPDHAMPQQPSHEMPPKPPLFS